MNTDMGKQNSPSDRNEPNPILTTKPSLGKSELTPIPKDHNEPTLDLTRVRGSDVYILRRRATTRTSEHIEPSGQIQQGASTHSYANKRWRSVDCQ